jgi:hypothetical protein
MEAAGYSEAFFGLYAWFNVQLRTGTTQSVHIVNRLRAGKSGVLIPVKAR